MKLAPFVALTLLVVPPRRPATSDRFPRTPILRSQRGFARPNRQVARRVAMKRTAIGRACASESWGANPRSSSDRGRPRLTATTLALLIHRTCVLCI